MDGDDGDEDADADGDGQVRANCTRGPDREANLGKPPAVVAALPPAVGRPSFPIMASGQPGKDLRDLYIYAVHQSGTWLWLPPLAPIAPSHVVNIYEICDLRLICGQEFFFSFRRLWRNRDKIEHRFVNSISPDER